MAKYRGRRIGQNFLPPVLTPFQLAQDSLLAGMGHDGKTRFLSWTNERGYVIDFISADGCERADTLQLRKWLGVETGKLSVD